MYREGRYVSKPNFPSRLGSEGSGIIDLIGNNNIKFKVGDEVTIIPFLSWDKHGNWTSYSSNKYGTYGDTAIVPAWTISKKVSNQSFEESSAIWAQYLTAWGGLVYNSNIEKRNCCIFTGASSSAAIGGMQIVKSFGLKAYAISRTLAKKENLLNVGMSDLEELPYQMYETKINKLQSKTSGKLIIKEYPTASAHTGHFKNLLNELALKKSFKPDILFVDYLNIAASARFKAGANVNSYTYIKAIAEELRGLAVEYNIPVFSATQTTRGGFVSSDIGMEDTAESFGLPATADFMFALISSEELEQKNQILIKQLKNRYNDPTVNRKFILGVDRSKMRFYDVEQKAQTDLVESGQTSTTDKNKFGKKLGQFSDFKI